MASNAKISEKAEAIFHRYDTNGNGKVEVGELAQMFADGGVDMEKAAQTAEVSELSKTIAFNNLGSNKF